MSNDDRIFDQFSESFVEDFSNVLSLESPWVVVTMDNEWFHLGLFDEFWITGMIVRDSIVGITKN